MGRTGRLAGEKGEKIMREVHSAVEEEDRKDEEGGGKWRRRRGDGGEMGDASSP